MPKRTPRGPKSPPRGAQEAPRDPEERAKSGARAAKRVPRTARSVPRAAQRTKIVDLSLGLRGLQKGYIFEEINESMHDKRLKITKSV